MGDLLHYKSTFMDRVRAKSSILKYHFNSMVAALGMKLIRSTVDSKTVSHARREFDILGWPADCEMQTIACKNVEDLLYVFASQGHSGMSAGYVLGLFNKLAQFKPISPLTGADSEWHEIGDNEYQNIRCSRVFKKNDQAYDIEGKVFNDGTGGYTSHDSHVNVEFPYIPHTEYIDVKP